MFDHIKWPQYEVDDALTELHESVDDLERVYWTLRQWVEEDGESGTNRYDEDDAIMLFHAIINIRKTTELLKSRFAIGHTDRGCCRVYQVNRRKESDEDEA